MADDEAICMVLITSPLLRWAACCQYGCPCCYLHALLYFAASRSCFVFCVNAQHLWMVLWQTVSGCVIATGMCSINASMHTPPSHHVKGVKRLSDDGTDLIC